MNCNNDTINILGTTYTIAIHKLSDDSFLDIHDGYTRTLDKEIVIADFTEKRFETQFPTEKSMRVAYNETLRHELIHAFLYESGLDVCSNDVTMWAKNEEMIDWFAIMSPKIFKVYNELGILES